MVATIAPGHAAGQQKPLILDGGMSRELMRLEAPFAQPEWSALSLIQAPSYVKRAHADFLAAGADIVTTNSYALVPFHIGEERFATSGAELAALSGHLAREAADEESARRGRKVLVAGCLPPIFGSYEPEMFDGGSVQWYLQVLVEALAPFVDFWLGETLSLVAEGDAVLEATKWTGKSVWISFCPDDGEKGSLTKPKLRSGESIQQVVRWARDRYHEGRIEALLFNCCRPDFVSAALDSAVAVLDEQDGKADSQGQALQLGVYANAFMPLDNEHAANEDVSATDAELTPEAYARFAAKWRSNGASIVGGCCGIGHFHIGAVAKALR